MLNADAVFDSMKGERKVTQETTKESSEETFFKENTAIAFVGGSQKEKMTLSEMLKSPLLMKIEKLFFEIEEGDITKEEKYTKLIDIAHSITNVCGMELGSNNPVYEKYAMIHAEIPIQMRKDTSEGEEFSFLNIEKVEKKVSVYFLNKMLGRIALNLRGEAPLDADSEVYYDYVFSLVYISLKKIFEEVKAEILSK